MIAKLVNYFGDKKFRKSRWRSLLVVLVIIVLADFLVSRPHVDHFWRGLPGFAAVFGFISCVAIIFISKFI